MRGRYSEPTNLLFNKGDWLATQEGWKKKLVAEIDGMNGDQLLNTSTVDLSGYYADKYKFTAPELDVASVVVDQRETQIDVSQDLNRWITDRSRPVLVPGTSVDVEVQYSGDKIGFDIQPSTRTYNNPRASVGDGVLNFSVTGTNLQPENVKQQIDAIIEEIKKHLGWLANDARGYNASLESLASQHIERRKQKLLSDKSLVAGLGFKMKARPGAAETFTAPNVRRIIRPAAPLPTASREPFKPEPTLGGEDYEHILNVLENMVRVMEQSPGAFRTIDEESLRTHFLVQLNGHFAGDATGETFNYEGKTDILVKVDGKNIFIGECKFWSGEKGYLETLDQVLSYLSWRDTKAAVLIFSRNQDFSGVLNKIAAATPAHSNFKKLIKQRSDSSWTYLFGHKDDNNREITVTVQAYCVPDRITPRLGN